MLNKVRTLLGMEVKLEQMKLADGISVLESDSFEPKMEVFIITEDEQKIPLPVGEYEMEDGRILVIETEGIIKELKEAPAAEEEAPMEETTPEVPVEAAEEVKTTPKKTVESVIKETFFSEIENLKKENEELKAKIELLSKVETVELSEEVEEEPKPINFNPENKSELVNFKIGAKGNQSTLNSIFSKIS